jgi:ribosomal-protein-serine acetyltransferase
MAVLGVRHPELAATTVGGVSLLLRPPRHGDEEPLYHAVRASIERVAAWMPWCHVDYAMKDASDWVACCEGQWRDPEGERDFIMLDCAAGRVIGCAGLNQFNRFNRFANLGYWVREGYEGKGVASTAARLIARYGFEEVGLRRIEIVPQVANATSRRVAEKAGARFEGIARNRLHYRGGPRDAAMYALVPGDLPR